MTTISRLLLPDSERTDAWRALRQKHVTASIVAALPAFHCHPYKTPLKLYMEKRGLYLPERDNKVMRRGRIFEPAVPKAVSEERPEWCLEEVAAYFYDEQERVGATPDYWIFGDMRGRGVLQCKTLNRDAYETEWLDGTEAPRWIVLQVRLETMMTGAAFGAIAGLTVESYDPKLALIDVPREAAAEQEIMEAVRAFWHDVDAGNEPDPIYGADSEQIRRLTGQEQPGATFDAAGRNDLPDLLEQRALLKARMNRDEARCTEIEDEIRFTMGGAERIVGLPNWSITYKTRTRAARFVPANSWRQLDIRDKRPKQERPQ
jgi:predicted phage-related endonuclease